VEERAMTSPMPPLLKSITLEGFLSFGPEAVTIPLTPLNVLIGPNGSGKSNLVEALSVLRALPKDLSLPIRQGGGIKDWLWWREGYEGGPVARLEVLFAKGKVSVLARGPAVRYYLVLGALSDSFMVLDERAENESLEEGGLKPHFYFGYENGRWILNARHERREIQRADIDPTQSILSQLRDPPWQHVAQRPGDEWEQPAGATEDHLHLMVQCMEAWFLADRRALGEYFGQGFQESALPAATCVPEDVGKPDLYKRLKQATSKTKTKGAYDKGKHSFKLLAMLDPNLVRPAAGLSGSS
jgi:hypothetical protein